MQSAITYRCISQNDYEQWLGLWNGYNKFYGRSGPTALHPEIIKTTWARFFDTYEPVHAVVAEQNGSLVGLAHYLFHRSTISIEPTCYLQDLFTAEEARGKGIGRALIDEVYKRAGSAGCKRLYWLTHETNQTAIQLYEKVAERSGFIVFKKMID